MIHFISLASHRSIAAAGRRDSHAEMERRCLVEQQGARRPPAGVKFCVCRRGMVSCRPSNMINCRVQQFAARKRRATAAQRLPNGFCLSAHVVPHGISIDETRCWTCVTRVGIPANGDSQELVSTCALCSCLATAFGFLCFRGPSIAVSWHMYVSFVRTVSMDGQWPAGVCIDQQNIFMDSSSRE